MPATGAKYNQKGNKVFIWLASAPSDLDAPTQAELGAGSDVTADIDPTAIEGFSTSTSYIEAETLDTYEIEQAPDKVTPDASSLTFYQRYASLTTWDLFDDATTGYLAVCPEGLGSTKPVYIYPVEVAKRTPMNGTGWDMFRVDFAITGTIHDDGVQAA